MADIKKIKIGSTIYDIKDATAARSNHTHSFDTISNRGEAFLSWGGKNFSGSYGPIDAAMVPELGANRLAFMPANAVTIEYSRDGGSTWTDYGPTDSQKVDLFNGRGASFTIGKATSGAGNIATNKYQLRVNIYTSAGQVYTALNKFVIYLSTSGTNNNWCTIRARTQSDYTAGNDKWTTFANKISVSGWSGYNVINTSGITTYGNTASTQYGHIQFIFGCDTGSTNNSYAGLNISKIFGFGGVGWTTPSTMAKTGQMYTYDSSQNVTFPEGVSAKSFTEGGKSLASKYLGKTAKAADADKLDGNDSTYYLNYNNLSNKPTIPTDTNQTIKSGATTFGVNDVVEIAAGNNVKVTPDATNKKITISATDTTYSTATSSALGLVKSSTTGTAANRDYSVQVNSDGTMKVNVPWTDTDTNTHNSHIVYSGKKSDGTTDISSGTASSGNITLGDSGVNAGTYRSVTVNSKGIVVAGSSTDADTNTWRKVQLDGADKLGTETSTKPLNIKAGSNMNIAESNGTFTFNVTDITDDNVKLSADVWTDKTIGYINGTSTSPKKIANAGDTLKTMFTNIFGTITDDTSNLIEYYPRISSVSIGSDYYEYGTTFKKVDVKITTAAGKYRYGPEVKGAGWNGSYSLSGTGFVSKENSADNTQTVDLTSQFTVDGNNELTLIVSRKYDAATNNAQSKMGNLTTQRIEAGTATKEVTFKPKAKKYIYWATSTSTTTPATWKIYTPSTTSIEKLKLSCNANEYIWIAAATTDNITKIYAWNDASNKFNTDPLPTTRTGKTSITNSQNVSAPDYYIYRTNMMLQDVDTYFKLAEDKVNN